MTDAPPATALGRIRDLWWDGFVECHAREGPETTLDKLDVFMSDGRDRLQAMAQAHADASESPSTPRHTLLVNQFLKSNTGKMFERFIALALAYSLERVDSAYCVQPFRAKEIKNAPGLCRDDFKVTFKFGDGTLYTHIDADVFAFNPNDREAEVFMISVKSTLKDRFHNVPFWNLLRRAAVSKDFPEVVAGNLAVLDRLRYVAVCSDLAAEQPDFGTDAGARNLLQVDASLLDGAYVTSSRARGLPNECTDSLGDIRAHAFFRYSCFYKVLAERT